MSKLIFCEIEYCICGICAKIQYRKVNRKLTLRSLKEVLNSMKECKLAAQKLHRDRNSFEKMLDNLGIPISIWFFVIVRI